MNGGRLYIDAASTSFGFRSFAGIGKNGGRLIVYSDRS
jgi:hypothetical protein